MLEEEAEYFAGCVRSAWIGEGTGCTAAEPGVAGVVDEPFFYLCVAGGIDVICSGVGVTVWGSAGLLLGAEGDSVYCLDNDCVGVSGVDGRILVTVKNDCWDQASFVGVGRYGSAAALHCGEG
jgi:hypothetical protein